MKLNELKAPKICPVAVLTNNKVGPLLSQSLWNNSVEGPKWLTLYNNLHVIIFGKINNKSVVIKSLDKIFENLNNFL